MFCLKFLVFLGTLVQIAICIPLPQDGGPIRPVIINEPGPPVTPNLEADPIPYSLKLLSWNIRYDSSYSSWWKRDDNVQDNTQTSPNIESRLDRRGYNNGCIGQGYPYETSGEQPWFKRRYLIADTVAWEEPSIILMQEVLHHQLQDLHHLLPEYDYIGVGRDDGKEEGEHLPIFFKRNEFSLVSYHYFWLSPTPQKPSKGWDASNNRMVTVARLRKIRQNVRDNNANIPPPVRPTSPVDSIEDLIEDVDSGDIFVACTQLDDRGQIARVQSSYIMLDKLKPIMKLKQNNMFILGGDLNSGNSDQSYKILAAEADDHDFSANEFSTSPFNGAFLDTRRHFMSNNRVISDNPKDPQDLPIPQDVNSVQRLYYPYGETYTWTGFTYKEERMLIDDILIANNGALAIPKTDPPIINDSPINVKQDIADQGQDIVNKAQEPQWILDRYGVLPTRYEYKFRASDHRPVVIRLQRIAEP